VAEHQAFQECEDFEEPERILGEHVQKQEEEIPAPLKARRRGGGAGQGREPPDGGAEPGKAALTRRAVPGATFFKGGSAGPVGREPGV